MGEIPLEDVILRLIVIEALPSSGDCHEVPYVILVIHLLRCSLLVCCRATPLEVKPAHPLLDLPSHVHAIVVVPSRLQSDTEGVPRTSGRRCHPHCSISSSLHPPVALHQAIIHLIRSKLHLTSMQPIVGVVAVVLAAKAKPRVGSRTPRMNGIEVEVETAVLGATARNCVG